MNPTNVSKSDVTDQMEIEMPAASKVEIAADKKASLGNQSQSTMTMKTPDTKKPTKRITPIVIN